MYAIIQNGGRQFRVEKGAVVEMNRIGAKVGDDIKFEQVLLIGGEQLLVAPDALKGATVSGKVVAHTRGPKQDAWKYKPKKYYRRRLGSREDRTRVEISEIVVP